MTMENDIVSKRLRKLSFEFEVPMEDIRQLFYDEFYKLKSGNPEKKEMWLSTHALTLVNRILRNPTRITLNSSNGEDNKTKKITIRVTPEMKEKMNERCKKENTSISEEMRKMIKKWLE